jgi:hypothetical protein
VSATFAEHEVAVEQLGELTMDFLKDMQVKMGHCLKIMKLVRNRMRDTTRPPDAHLGWGDCCSRDCCWLIMDYSLYFYNVHKENKMKRRSRSRDAS